MSSNFISKFKASPFGNRLFSVFRYFSMFSVIATIAAIGILGGIFFAYIDTAGALTPDQLKLKDTATTIYDINQKPVEFISSGENREWVEIGKVPVSLKQAFISIEDERFYRHNGIDLRRIASAVFSYFKPGAQKFGASTITQQVVKNLTGDKENRLKRKIQEQWRALQLEKKLTKEQILELYLNIVPLGNGVNGVQAGAKAYFNKDVSELTVAEAASLAGITKWPTYYDPYTKPENNKKRQELVLAQMKKLEYINEAQYQEAVNEKLVFKKSSIEKISNHSFFADQVINDVVRDLQEEKGISKSFAEKMVYGGGLKIYTTMDSKVQQAMDNVYTNPKSFVHVNGTQPESAMVILDPKTGQVRGLIGGVGEKKGKRTFNRATQSQRQPGSSIKPLAVYAPAIEYGKITPNSVFDDSPLRIGNWEPHNYDNTFRGNVTIRYAVTHSINIVAIKVLQKLDIDNSFAFLKRLGISTLEASDKDYAPLALGALSKGVSPLEMAAAYAPFANNGIYIKPYTYLKVVDSDGKVLLENTSTESRVVMSEETASTITDLLQNVVTSGTATRARLSKMPAAGKTGTAADMKDKWFVGYTPYYVGAVWYGYDHPQELPRATWDSALNLWKNVMEQVHAGLAPKNFSAAKDFANQVAICSLTGERATDLCYKDINGSTVVMKTFFGGNAPTNYCSIHKPVKICTTSNQLATEYCPDDEVVEKSVAVKDGEPIPLQNCTMHGPGSKPTGTKKPGKTTSDKTIVEPPDGYPQVIVPNGGLPNDIPEDIINND